MLYFTVERKKYKKILYETKISFIFYSRSFYIWNDADTDVVD